MVLLPGCTCCQSLCTICPDWCSYTAQVLSPSVAASGVAFGSSVNPDCRPTSSIEFDKSYGVCPGYTYTDVSHVHDFCRFETCDTACAISSSGAQEIDNQLAKLSRLSLTMRPSGTNTGGLPFGVGLSVGARSFGWANCDTENLEARINGASITTGIQCRYIPELPASQLEIYADFVALVRIYRRPDILSPWEVPYYRRVEKWGVYPIDRVCGQEQLDRRCDYVADNAVRVLPPEGFFPLDFSVSSTGTTLGGWQYEIDENPSASTSDPSYAIAEANLSCLLSTFATTVRFGRRQCRDVNPLP